MAGIPGDYSGKAAKASADGIAGLVAVVDGQPQFLASDELGRLWNRLFVNGAAVSTANPLPTTPGAGVVTMVEGDVAHDTPDSYVTNFPVLTGAHANATPPAAVSENDRVDQSGNLFGMARVVVGGVNGAGGAADTRVAAATAIVEADIALAVQAPVLGVSTGAAVVTDAAGTLQQYLRGLVSRASTDAQGLFVVGNIEHSGVDDIPGRPVEIGANAVTDPATGHATGVSVADRSRAVCDTRGRVIVVVGGDLGHDAANGLSGDKSRPVLLGGNSVATGSVQATVSAANDRTVLATNLFGMLHTTMVENPLSVASSGWTYLTPTVGDANSRLVIKASAGRLRYLRAINTAASTLYLQVHNTTAVGTIATGTRAWCAVAVPAGGEADLSFETCNLVLGTGIAVSFSTDQLTYAAPATTGEYCGIYA